MLATPLTIFIGGCNPDRHLRNDLAGHTHGDIEVTLVGIVCNGQGAVVVVHHVDGNIRLLG